MNNCPTKIFFFSLLVMTRLLSASSQSVFSDLSNQLGPFKGGALHPAYKGNTWLTHPQMSGPASIDFDPFGRAFINEARRMGRGVPDTRSSSWRALEDFRLKTVEDRLASYQRNQDKKEMSWYTGTPDRVLRFVDSDGNGAPDTGSVFDDRCKEALDGIGFSLLADRDAVYYTCIPALRKLTDADNDGVAEKHERLVEGFGVRACFKGHDLHGVTRGPDGRLYFSVGDRGYSVIDDAGVRRAAPQRGAIFRCDDDGTNFEVYAHGLRNPQEIAFDEFGNLFTFDNTGDFGDKARVVYVLDNSDSGWTADYQSHHQHVNKLDWGKFHLWHTAWVGEGSYDLYSKSAPQWIHPPVGHVGNGPSGVVRLTGPAVPTDLRGKFLICNYRGSSTRSEVLSISILSKGAGFELVEVTPFLSALNASDVELGYDGRIYFVEYGSGWAPDDKGSVQVAEPLAENLKKSGMDVARIIKDGFDHRPVEALIDLLGHMDLRVRQEAQFALVRKGSEVAFPPFSKIIEASESASLSQVHAIWGIGQLARLGSDKANRLLIETLKHPRVELRANAARLCGDLKVADAQPHLISVLNNDSPRVVSLSAIALGRVAKAGDSKVVDALSAVARKNQGENFDITTRHAIVSALNRLATPEQAESWAKSDSLEIRMLGVITLRRLEHPGMVAYLQDADLGVRLETIRAMFDTSVIDTPVGARLLEPDYHGLPIFIQARLLVAATRFGSDAGFSRVLAMALDKDLDPKVQTLAFRALERWDVYPQIDPFLGSLRPSPHRREKSSVLAANRSSSYLSYLKQEKRTDFLTLATEVSAKLGISLDPADLQVQVLNPKLSTDLRAVFFGRLVASKGGIKDEALTKLLHDPQPKMRALALGEAYERRMEGVDALAEKAVRAKRAPEVAKQGILSIGKRDPKRLLEFWQSRSGKDGIDADVWLDLYYALKQSKDPEVQSSVKSFGAKPSNLQNLALRGGDPRAGESVFRGQGACMQCHKINGEGGEQGPDLSIVGKHLGRGKLLESIVNPSAEISPGYGLSTVVLKNGEVYSGRLSSQSEKVVSLVSLDGQKMRFSGGEVDQVSPPISAMPPMGQALSPIDLRDLISYLESTRSNRALPSRSLKHGD